MPGRRRVPGWPLSRRATGAASSMWSTIVERLIALFGEEALGEQEDYDLDEESNVIEAVDRFLPMPSDDERGAREDLRPWRAHDTGQTMALRTTRRQEVVAIEGSSQRCSTYPI